MHKVSRARSFECAGFSTGDTHDAPLDLIIRKPCTKSLLPSARYFHQLVETRKPQMQFEAVHALQVLDRLADGTAIAAP